MKLPCVDCHVYTMYTMYTMCMTVSHVRPDQCNLLRLIKDHYMKFVYEITDIIQKVLHSLTDTKQINQIETEC